METITFYYECPECKSSQEVYLPTKQLGEIVDGGGYKFETECSNCAQSLFITLTYDVETKKIQGE